MPRSVSRPALLLPVLLVALPWLGMAAGRHPRVDATQACVSQSCHAPLGEKPAAGGAVHDPFSGGDCVSCHDLASAPEAHYVRGAPAAPGEAAGSVLAWDLALCSGCHGEGLYARDAPPRTTGFADGSRNLHALHVQAGRGRRCLTCHEPHASAQPCLLRERIPARGGARISQQFRGEPKGGWCKTGCHAPKRYTR
jgi:predicted CXXCH cytochrome family protein